jgi:HCOMODA/2-hydroxy-3-carboxy-muconic semialdehyde decarboxylase
VVASFGHVCFCNPEILSHYLLSRARAPHCVELRDMTEFAYQANVIGYEPGKPYSERFVHGSVLEARPDVMAVFHNHNPNVVSCIVQTKKKMRPIMHLCAPLSSDIPTWDIAGNFDTTNLLATSVDMGRGLACCLGRQRVAIMRGHGNVVTGKNLREAVYLSIYKQLHADMLIKA